MGKAIFWDFDGTLVHSDHLWRRVALEILRERGLAGCIALDTLTPYMSHGYPWHFPDEPHPEFCDGLGFWRWAEAHFARAFVQMGFDGALSQTMALEIRPRILDASNYTLMDDAAYVLRAAMEMGYRNYILSNNYPELEQVVMGLGLRPYFSGIITSGQEEWEKPAPQLFKKALKLAGAPQTAFMIGDNSIADIQGGRRAGMRTIYIGTDAGGADYAAATLREVLRYI